MPYFLCLFVIGIPIMLMELSLGMMFRAGDIESFGGIHRRLRGIGISTIVAAVLLASYYGASRPPPYKPVCLHASRLLRRGRDRR